MIAVVSDSHIGRKAEEVTEKFLGLAEEADLTVHCGDFETEEVYEMFDGLGEFVAVMGNCDRFELDDYQDFKHEGVTFGVFHGKGIHPRGDRDTLANIAEKMGVKVLFNGHTHQQEAVKHEGKILLNPGSCTGASGGSYSGGNPEMMTVEVEDDVLQVQLMELVDGEIEVEEEEFEL